MSARVHEPVMAHATYVSEILGVPGSLMRYSWSLGIPFLLCPCLPSSAAARELDPERKSPVPDNPKALCSCPSIGVNRSRLRWFACITGSSWRLSRRVADGMGCPNVIGTDALGRDPADGICGAKISSGGVVGAGDEAFGLGILAKGGGAVRERCGRGVSGSEGISPSGDDMAVGIDVCYSHSRYVPYGQQRSSYRRVNDHWNLGYFLRLHPVRLTGAPQAKSTLTCDYASYLRLVRLRRRRVSRFLLCALALPLCVWAPPLS